MVQGKTSSEEIKAEAVKDGMVTLRQDGINRTLVGDTTLSEIVRVTIEYGKARSTKRGVGPGRKEHYEFQVPRDRKNGKTRTRPHRGGRGVKREKRNEEQGPLPRLAEGNRIQGKKRSLFFSFGIRQNLPIQLARQLASLLKGGVPLFQALTIIANQLEGDREKDIVGYLRDEVKGGSPLSEALKAYPEIFDNLFVYSVAGRRKDGGPRFDPQVSGGSA